jgi:hypothetical protein
MSIDRMPPGLRAASDLRVAKDGVITSRFTTSSSPAIHSIMLRSLGYVDIEFTEGVFIRESEIDSYLKVTDTAAQKCPYASTGTAEGYQLRLTFKCDAQVWPSRRAHVAVQPGLQSAGKLPLGVMDSSATSSAAVVRTLPFERDIDFSAGSSCSGDGSCLAVDPLPGSN